jgi:two-component system, OmpR family, response regulator
MDVVLVRWPAEGERRRRLADAGVARLLLVDSSEPPPQVVDPFEDWIRVPADEHDVQARLATLAARMGRANPTSVPTLDDDGVIRCNGAWASLPPVEARLTAALLERLGAVVSRDALAKAGWPEGAPGRNALDVHVLRLRRRLAPVGLVIRTVRSRGYLLELSDERQQTVRQA